MHLLHSSARSLCCKTASGRIGTASWCRVHLHHQPARARPRLQRDSTCQGVLNTEVSNADSWALATRAAMLNLRAAELNDCIQSDPQNAWLAVCDPQRLFALRELCRLLEADIRAALQLVQRIPSLLDVPSRTLEDNAQGLQLMLQLSRPDFLQLVSTAPDLLLAGPAAVEAQVQRVAWGLGLPATPADASRLLQLLAHLGPEGLCDAKATVEKVRAFIIALSLSPAAALVLLQSELQQGHDVRSLLVPDAVSQLASDWRSLSEAVDLPLSEMMLAVARQGAQPGGRYSLSAVALLQSDVSALKSTCQLEPRTVCQLLLSAPRLVSVPASFWQLLLQYMLFLVPQWRKQLDALPAAEAGVLLSQLFREDGSDVEDVVAVNGREALFATADYAYNQELTVLEALLDTGINAPRLSSPTHITAGRVWRLLYLCNPRLVAAQQVLQDTPASPSTASSPWWVLGLQLPLPLVNQMQRRGVLSCELPLNPVSPHEADSKAAGASGGSNARTTAGRRGFGAEGIESLYSVITANTAEFCARHPGYAHWLHNASFELEWSNSKTTVPVATWDV